MFLFANAADKTILPQTLDAINFLQFTGLKDKNGNEIYEGDVLEMADNFPAVVQWNEHEGKWEMKETQIHHDDFGARIHDMRAYTSIPAVIGNIYENPELLKGDEV